MANPPIRYLEDVLVEHREELEFLWARRRTAHDDPDETVKALLDLDERVAAHAQGLLAVPEALPVLLAEGLAAESPTAVFASAFPLLLVGTPEADRLVLDGFAAAQGPALRGYAEALAAGASAATLPALRTSVKDAEPARALAALEALAYRSPDDCNAEGLAPFMHHAEPAPRRDCWRIAGLLRTPLVTSRYKKAAEDVDPVARDAALRASAWGRQPWLLDHVRALARTFKPTEAESLRLVAALGGPDDLKLIRQPRWSDVLGAAWFGILAEAGRPAVVPDLIRGMEHADPRLAVAAGAAFERITGRSAASDKRVPLPPADGSTPDAFEAEFLDEAFLPDPARARSEWKAMAGRFGADTRIRRGRAIDEDETPDARLAVDLPGRQSWALRRRLADPKAPGLVALLRFPQPA